MAIKTFADAKSYIESLPSSFDAKYSPHFIERAEVFARSLGDPQDSYPIVHVGGTAGKGSTATMVAAILQSAGYRVGLHVSPHLQDIRERAQVNGGLMSEGKFVNLVRKLREHVDFVEESHSYGKPTYFETLVMLAFEHFRREKVDVAVIEVGMGGTFDATNIVKSKVAVLTNVGLDHTEVLGGTVEEIAENKVGIFKTGIEVVSGVTQQSVIAIVERKAGEMGCSLDLLGREIGYSIKSSKLSGTVFDLTINGVAYNDLELAAVGEHQVKNASLAVDAAMKLAKHGFTIREESVRHALKATNIPGRFEVVGRKPVVILDGAHNAMKMAALVDVMWKLYPGKKIRFVFAVKKGKRAGDMLSLLSPIARKFYFCRFESTTDFGRRMAQDPRELARLTAVESEAMDEPVSAYKKALSEMRGDEILCITGSLYVVGELRNILAK